MQDSTRTAGRDGSRRPDRAWRAALGTALACLAACSAGGPSGSGGGPGGGGGGGGSGGGGSGGGTGQRLVITPHFDVENASSEARTDTVLASIPFPIGMIANLDNVGVSGRATAWMPMQTWPDGTVRVAQAQFTDDFAANETKSYDVVREVTPLTGPFAANEWLAQFGDRLLVRPRVRDINGNAYEAQTSVLGGSLLHETPLVRVTRKRVYHYKTGSGGITRDFLSSTFYVYEYHDVPYVTVDWILGNDYQGIDDPAGSTDPNLYPLGGVDVNEASLLVKGADEVRGFRPDWHAIEAPVAEGEWVRFRTMTDTYVDDCQTRRYRFQLRVEHPGATDEVKRRWQRSYTARVEAPFYPLCDLPTYQKSGGLGLHGGPVDGPADAASRAADDYDRWIHGDHFGTWGDFGDVNYTGTSGTPRNTPLSWDVAHAIQARNRDLMALFESKAWMQAIRPYHLYGLTVGAEQDLYLWYSMVMNPLSSDISNESLGRRALWRNDPFPQLRTRVDYRAHSFNGYDAEHWTTDILFDYWTMSGDHWAREELRQLGQSLKGCMRLVEYPSANMRVARAEGWTMCGFVQSFLATGDSSTKDYAIRRIREIVQVQRWRDHAGRPMNEYGPDARYGIGTNTTGYPAWEMGSVMLGYLAAYRFFGSTDALEVAEDVVRAVDYSWVSNYTNPRTGQFVADAARYVTPLRDNGQHVPANFRDADPAFGAIVPSIPLGSVNEFLVAGLAVMHEHTQNATIRERAAWQLAKFHPEPVDDDHRWNKWFLIAPFLYPHNRQN